MLTQRALWLCVVLSVGCATRPHSAVAVATEGTNDPVVLLYTSEDYPAVASFRRGFVPRSTRPVADCIIADNIAPALMASSVAALRPALIVALGDGAVAFAQNYLPQVPMVYAMAHDAEAKKIKHPGVSGAPLAAAELLMYKLVMKGMKRVVSFYPADEPRNADHDRAEAAGVGVELTQVPVSPGDDFVRLYAQHCKNVDAVWLREAWDSSSPTLNRDVSQLSTAARIPLLCSRAQGCADLGALMAVRANHYNIGGQAANLANLVLKGENPRQSASDALAMGGDLLVNMQVAGAMGLDIPVQATPFIHELDQE